MSQQWKWREEGSSRGSHRIKKNFGEGQGGIGSAFDSVMEIAENTFHLAYIWYSSSKCVEPKAPKPLFSNELQFPEDLDFCRVRAAGGGGGGLLPFTAPIRVALCLRQFCKGLEQWLRAYNPTNQPIWVWTLTCACFGCGAGHLNDLLLISHLELWK